MQISNLEHLQVANLEEVQGGYDYGHDIGYGRRHYPGKSGVKKGFNRFPGYNNPLVDLDVITSINNTKITQTQLDFCGFGYGQKQEAIVQKSYDNDQHRDSLVVKINPLRIGKC